MGSISTTEVRMGFCGLERAAARCIRMMAEFRLFQAPQIPGNLVHSIDHDSAERYGLEQAVASAGVWAVISAVSGDSFPRSHVMMISAHPDGSVWFSPRPAGKYEQGRLSTDGQDGFSCKPYFPLVRWFDGTVGLSKFEDGKFSVPLVFRATLVAVLRLHRSKDGAFGF